MGDIFDKVHHYLEIADGYVWHPYFMVTILVGTGLYLTARFVVPQVRFFGHALALVSGRYDKKEDKGDVSHFQALSAALSATVGIGNIAGVATAIHLGGPGAVFWLWVSGFLGMATKMTSCALAVRYRDILPDGTVAGGPMFTIKNALPRWKPLAYAFATFTAVSAAFGAGNAVQSNTIAVQLNQAFGFPRWIVGLVISSLVAVVILGGIKRIGAVASKLVPLMGTLYFLGAVVIVAMNISGVPDAFSLILHSAFNPTAATGGFVGVAVTTAIRFGIARGTFSNEAGQGSAPIAHAAARSDPPVREGFVALLEPFIDTLVICTLTALVILTTGAWKDKTEGTLSLAQTDIFREAVRDYEDAQDESKLYSGPVSFEEGMPRGGLLMFYERSLVEAPRLTLDGEPFTGIIDFEDGKPLAAQTSREGEEVPEGLQPRKRKLTAQEIGAIDVDGYFCQTGAVLTSTAFEQSLGFWGKLIVIVGIVLFGYSTSITWSYYGDRAVTFLFGIRAVTPYRILFVVMNFLGALVTLNIVWTMADIFNALMILPNVISLWLLSGVVGHMIKRYSIKDGGIDLDASGTRERPAGRRKKKKK
jgi:AGCS family alanine or glycine:cation symporter